ncbi:MAG: hypothetical protein EOM40_05230, partial [Clostridia bacterium]|nr:hypothetical protein [Clostridia bacterium]
MALSARMARSKTPNFRCRTSRRNYQNTGNALFTGPYRYTNPCIKNVVLIDPCCGSAGMFVSSIKFVERHNGNRSKISIVGQERIPDTWRLAKMNLAIRGIAHNLGERNESTFAEDLHK